MSEALSVSDLLQLIGGALTRAAPDPVWVRGEVSGFKRTHRGAGFFRLVDTGSSDHVIDVAARGMTMSAIDAALDAAGVGSLRSGIELKMRGQVGLNTKNSTVQLTLLEVDPAFTAGRLAIDRAEVLRRMSADGSLGANKRHPVPLVPLKVGLVTSRGSAGHADFIGQLAASGYRFSVKTAHSSMQGDRAVSGLVSSLARVAQERIDMVVVVRGGGSKLDLAVFDNEEVGRAVSVMPVPVITGIGHETDRCVADEAAAVSVKTPTAAGGWLVDRVGEYDRRIDRARSEIENKARDVLGRSTRELRDVATRVAAMRGAIVRQSELLNMLSTGLVDRSMAGLQREQTRLELMKETLESMGVEPTLRRGFALVTRGDGTVGRATTLTPGERVTVRFADGTVGMIVEETD